MKKLGLALGAGGARGVAHMGFLKALEEAGIKPDYITGASMGAVVGGAYAAGVSLNVMEKAVTGLRLLDLITPANDTLTPNPSYMLGQADPSRPSGRPRLIKEI